MMDAIDSAPVVEKNKRVTLMMKPLLKKKLLSCLISFVISVEVNHFKPHYRISYIR